MSLIPSIVFPAALVAVGGAVVASNGRDLYFGLASRRWSATRGRVVAVETHEGTLWHGDSSVILSYEYEVDGTTYCSRRYDFAGRNAGPTAGHVLLETPVGAWSPVLYDARRPERSALRAGVGLQSVASVAIGAGIGGLGLLGLIGILLSAPG